MQLLMQLIRSLPLGDGTTTSGWIRRVLLSVGVIGAGQWLLSDVVHVPGGGLGVAAAATGLWWLSRPPKQPSFREPASLKGWIQRCEEVLNQFAELEVSLGLQGLRSPRETELPR